MRAYCKQPSAEKRGWGLLLGRGLCTAQEALKHRSSGSASSAVKKTKSKTWRPKLFSSTVTKRAQHCLHKRLLRKATKLEVMVLKMHKKCDCFPTSKQRDNLPWGHSLHCHKCKLVTGEELCMIRSYEPPQTHKIQFIQNVGGKKKNSFFDKIC